MSIQESIIKSLSYNLFGEHIICNKLFCYGEPRYITVIIVEILFVLMRFLFFLSGAYLLKSICKENNNWLCCILVFALLQWLHLANSFYSSIF
jgi:hypothetical protein